MALSYIDELKFQGDLMMLATVSYKSMYVTLLFIVDSWTTTFSISFLLNYLTNCYQFRLLI